MKQLRSSFYCHVRNPNLFVVFYEEPTLRRKFGADYEEYCRNVGRWRPRVQGWDGPH